MILYDYIILYYIRLYYMNILYYIIPGWLIKSMHPSVGIHAKARNYGVHARGVGASQVSASLR